MSRIARFRSELATDARREEIRRLVAGAFDLRASRGQHPLPAVLNDEIENVTKDGTECSSFKECKGLLEDGEDIDDTGASGPLDLTPSPPEVPGDPDDRRYRGGSSSSSDQSGTQLPPGARRSAQLMGAGRQCRVGLGQRIQVQDGEQHDQP